MCVCWAVGGGGGGKSSSWINSKQARCDVSHVENGVVIFHHDGYLRSVNKATTQSPGSDNTTWWPSHHL